MTIYPQLVPWPLWLGLACALLVAVHVLFRRRETFAVFAAGGMVALLLAAILAAAVPRSAVHAIPGAGAATGNPAPRTPAPSTSAGRISTPGETMGLTAPRFPRGNVRIGGTASWFRSPAGVSAAGPALRRFLGPDWRGTWVRVCAEACVVTRLGDWCDCPRRLVDLDDDAFARLAPLAVGILRVTVSRIEPPATDTAGG